MYQYVVVCLLVSLLVPMGIGWPDVSLAAPLERAQAGIAGRADAAGVGVNAMVELGTPGGGGTQPQRDALVASLSSPSVGQGGGPIVPALATEATTLITGTVDGGALGTSLSTAGDVDGDGLSDVIVGVPGNNQALLYFGDAGACGCRRQP